MAVPAAVTVDALKSYLNIASGADDAAVAAVGAAATRQAEHHCGAIVQRTVTERLRGYGALFPRTGPVVSVTTVLLPDGTDPHPGGTYSFDDGILAPVGGVLPNGTYVVTYVVGHAATVADVPEDIAEAVCVIAQHLWSARRARGVRPDSFGSDDGYSTAFAIPRRAAELLAPYRVVRIA